VQRGQRVKKLNGHYHCAEPRKRHQHPAHQLGDYPLDSGQASQAESPRNMRSRPRTLMQQCVATGAWRTSGSHSPLDP
jgi:hypothetical protein